MFLIFGEMADYDIGAANVSALSSCRSPFKVTSRMAKSLLDAGTKRLSGFEPRHHDTQKQKRNIARFGHML
jgi:hypothetical protein